MRTSAYPWAKECGQQERDDDRHREQGRHPGDASQVEPEEPEHEEENRDDVEDQRPRRRERVPQDAPDTDGDREPDHDLDARRQAAQASGRVPGSPRGDQKGRITQRVQRLREQPRARPFTVGIHHGGVLQVVDRAEAPCRAASLPSLRDPHHRSSASSRPGSGTGTPVLNESPPLAAPVTAGRRATLF